MTAADQSESDLLKATLGTMIINGPMLGYWMPAALSGLAVLGGLIYLTSIVAFWYARRTIRRAIYRDLGRIMTREQIDRLLDEVRRKR